MNILIESLKRLYKDGKIDEEKIRQLLNKGTINKEQQEYILWKEDE